VVGRRQAMPESLPHRSRADQADLHTEIFTLTSSYSSS
jgi:hypothetical protein